VSQPGRPIRVTLVIGTADTGGAEGQLVRLAGLLHQRGMSVKVLFTRAGGPLTRLLDQAGVPWRVAASRRVPSPTVILLTELIGVARFLRREQPDIVFAWLGGAVWKALPIAKMLTKAKRVAAFRGEVPEAEIGRFTRILRRAVTAADAITINSPPLRDEALRWGARPDKITFIPNAVAIPQETADVSVEPPTAVVVANFQPYKGHRTLVEAIADVTCPLKFRFVGAGSQKDAIRQMVAERGLVDRIEFADEPANVPREIQGAQFAVHPSCKEGMPNAVLEELSWGLPIIATEVGATPLLVDDGV
jgi:L-malate glycosyltransferase